MAVDRTTRTNMVIINGTPVIDPSTWSYGLQDVSASDAGRDEAILMHKMRLGQVRTYQLGWKMIDPDNASQILQLINGEDFTMRLWDVLSNEYQTRTYYVGDRTAPMQQWMPNREDGKLFSNLSFTVIELWPDSNTTPRPDGGTSSGGGDVV